MSSRRLHVLLAALIGLGGCMPVQPAGGAPEAASGNDASTPGALPPGYGSLRQDDVSLGLARGAVRVQVTPLDASITRLTAPDTDARLSGLRERGGSGGAVFLVTVQTEAPGGASFEPANLRIESRGIMHRAESIVPLTPGWGAGQLRQRTVERALYRFDGSVDPAFDMVVVFGEVRSGSWADRLPMLDAERARVRARSGGGARQPSSPNFLIFR